MRASLDEEEEMEEMKVNGKELQEEGGRSKDGSRGYGDNTTKTEGSPQHSH